MLGIMIQQTAGAFSEAV